MATEDQIIALRRMVDEPGTAVYTNEELGQIIDSEGSLELAAAHVWELKAASFSTLVNVSESGSSRSNSDLHKNAIAMAKYWAGKVVEEVAIVADRTRVSGIVRP